MKITICNAKGGVGKTCIALNLAFEMKYGIITNDIYSPLESVIGPKHFIKVGTSEETRIDPDLTDDYPDFADDIDLIYDLQRPIGKREMKVIEASDWVIVPTLTDYIDMHVTSATLWRLQDVTDRIIIIINKTARNDFAEAREQLSKSFDYPFFEIRKYEAVPGVFDRKASLRDVMENPSQLCKTVFLQFEAIIKHVRGW